MTSSSPVKAYNATMGTSVESGRLLISAFMYCLESECLPIKFVAQNRTHLGFFKTPSLALTFKISAKSQNVYF